MVFHYIRFSTPRKDGPSMWDLLILRMLQKGFLALNWLRPENNGVNGYGSDTMVTGGCGVGWQWPGGG